MDLVIAHLTMTAEAYYNLLEVAKRDGIASRVTELQGAVGACLGLVTTFEELRDEASHKQQNNDEAN